MSIIFVLMLVGLLIYFLPTVVAYCRRHHQAPAILVLNTLLGWTLIGWVAACVWAATAIREEVAFVRTRSPPAEKKRPDTVQVRM
jgi:Superinfection immunity protein